MHILVIPSSPKRKPIYLQLLMHKTGFKCQSKKRMVKGFNPMFQPKAQSKLSHLEKTPHPIHLSLKMTVFVYFQIPLSSTYPSTPNFASSNGKKRNFQNEPLNPYVEHPKYLST